MVPISSGMRSALALATASLVAAGTLQVAAGTPIALADTRTVVVNASVGIALVGPNLRLAAASTPLELGTGIPDAIRIVATPDGQVFYVLARDGSVHAYGDAVHRGDARLPHPAVAMAVTGSGGGYWVFDALGHIYPFDTAHTYPFDTVPG